MIPSGVNLKIPKPFLEGMFDECDKHPSEETGGRLLGFAERIGPYLHVNIEALIAAGPNARRSSVSFFQDGEYQEGIFRAIEKRYPSILHLGNWHSHHCNGLETLSSGDCATYRANVNSSKHATDFFLALLLTKKTPGQLWRYEFKWFVFFRGNEHAHWIPNADVTISEEGNLRG